MTIVRLAVRLAVAQRDAREACGERRVVCKRRVMCIVHVNW